ncbi:MAG: glucose 1-dehydrogenase [Alphaproteobacteria bacterium]|nr:glucose 1-dehydrogenase [Alphaproteobacteria bacterium]
MPGRLAGKVAIITGAAKGLGEADARLFAQEGAQVVLTDVDEVNGARVAAEIGAAAAFLRQDVRHEREWTALIPEVVQRFGRLDILVNNAGVVEAGTIEDVTEADYRFIMAVSADGALWGCKHAIPAMRASGGGSIVNMASIASVQGEPSVAAYCAAKGAVEALTRAVAVHCAQLKDPIRCNSVHPVGIDTPMVRAMPERLAKLRESGSVVARQAPANSANRLGEPIDIANTVLFLASDESRFINGQAIIVDNSSSVTQGVVPS